MYRSEFLLPQGATTARYASVSIPADRIPPTPPTNAATETVRVSLPFWSGTVGEQFEPRLLEFIERKISSWLGRFQQQLRKFADLPVGWDSYEAEPPGRNSIEKAHNFLDLLAEMPDVSLVPSRVAPIADGGVAVSFLRDDFRASVDFLDSGEVVAIVAKRGSEADVWDVESNEELQDAIHRIHRALPQS